LALLELVDESDLDNLGRTIVVFIEFLVNPVESSLFFRFVKSPNDCEYLVSIIKVRSESCIILFFP